MRWPAPTQTPDEVTLNKPGKASRFAVGHDATVGYGSLQLGLKGPIRPACFGRIEPGAPLRQKHTGPCKSHKSGAKHGTESVRPEIALFGMECCMRSAATLVVAVAGAGHRAIRAY